MPAPVAVAPAVNAPTKAPVVPTPPAAKSPVAPAATEEARFEVTVDGKPAKLTRREIERYAGKGAFADQLVRQAREALSTTAKEREEREALKAKIKTDKTARDKWLREHGIEPDEFARERLESKISESQMTPEQRAIAERDAKIADLERAAQEVKARDDEQRLSARAEQRKTEISDTLDAAWERAGFERGADSFYTVYEVMKDYVRLGVIDPNQPFTAAIADRIIEEAQANVAQTDKRREAAVMKGLKGKALYDRLGKTVVDELNRYQVELIRGGGAKKAEAPKVAPVEKPSEYLTLEEARAVRAKLGR